MPRTWEVTGVYEPNPKGGGQLRSLAQDLRVAPDDPYVPPEIVKAQHLRPGCLIQGLAQEQDRRGPRLFKVQSIQGLSPLAWKDTPPLDQGVPIDPEERLTLEYPDSPMATRILDLFVPIGKGQRSLIVAPPRSGKTVLLQQLAKAIGVNHPGVTQLVLLVDERPEEVTDMRRTINGHVIASSSDFSTDNHVRVAELMTDYARREVESGKDVVLFLDSLTRLGRAFNKETRNSGRILSGGIDSRALEKPKRIFGAARKVQGGGSLTIIATILVGTGSRMDDVIFQEFKGTGNMELVLDRKLAEKRIWPAIDLGESGTRKEEKLLGEQELKAMARFRTALLSRPQAAWMPDLLQKMAGSRSNRELVEQLGARIVGL